MRFRRLSHLPGWVVSGHLICGWHAAPAGSSVSIFSWWSCTLWHAWHEPLGLWALYSLKLTLGAQFGLEVTWIWKCLSSFGRGGGEWWSGGGDQTTTAEPSFWRGRIFKLLLLSPVLSCPRSLTRSLFLWNSCLVMATFLIDNIDVAVCSGEIGNKLQC